MPTQNWQDLIAAAEKEDKKFQPVPAQDYNVVVVKSEPRTSSTGKQGYNIQTKIVDEGPSKGRVVFDTMWISPESPIALRIFFNQMKVLGLDTQYFASNPSPDQIAGALVGKVFRAEVIIKKNNKDEDVNEIKNYKTADSAAQAAAQNFLANNGSATTAAPAAPSPSAPAPTPAAPAPAAPAPAPVAPAPEPAPAAQPDVAAQEAAVPPSPAETAPAAPAPAPAQDNTLPPPPPPPVF
jgi:hypothetical protein